MKILSQGVGLIKAPLKQATKINRQGKIPMIKLNRMTDYAAVILSLMQNQQCADGAKSLSTTDIATLSGLGHPTVAQIMKKLARGGLVAATRGKDGGYSLNHAAEDISIIAIIEAMEGPIALTACVETTTDPCISRHSCCISGNWERINSAIAEALNAVSLADLVNPETMFPAPPSSKPQRTSHVSDS